MNARQLAALTVLLAIGAYSTVMAMQTLAIVALVLFLAVLYRGHTKELFQIAKELLSSARQAKLGRLELTLERRLETLGHSSAPIARQVAWARALVSSMSSKEVGLLLSISKVDRFRAIGGLKTRLRTLRELGLLEHDAATMEEAEQVWLTDLGKELADVLLDATTPTEGELALPE